MLRRRSLAVLALLAGAAGAVPASDESSAVSSARDTLAKWVETRQVISREREQWKLGREVLEQRISLVRGETADLQEKTAQTQTNIGQTEEKRRELVRESAGFKDAQATLVERIAVLEQKVLRVVAALPDPIGERVAPLSQRLPRDPSDTEQTLAERYQNIIGVLNEVNKFNRDITVTSEVRTLPDGSTAEVKAIYLGLGAAYYVTPNEDAAGIGRPTPEGWAWSEANELAPDVALAIKILQNEEVPAFVPLPVTIR